MTGIVRIVVSGMVSEEVRS